MGLRELVIDIFKERLKVFSEVNCLSEELLADPFPVLSNFDSVILIDVGVNEACPCACLEFVDQHPQLGHVSVRLDLGFLGNP
jgi:hypothetical protein